MGNVDCGPSLSNLERVLDSLPALTSIRFDEADRISCDAIKLCLARTTIKTLSFGPRATFTRVEPYSVDEFSTTSCISLTAFAYRMPRWREQLNRKRGKLGPRNLSEMYSREAACLAALVPALNTTVRHLTLPMESAPITSMAEMAWPRLTDLSIYGRYLNQLQVDSLPLLLLSLHDLRRLSITICRDDTIGRAPILGPTTPDESVLSGLESLTVAYPDPMDAIFAVSTADLTRLSIRDWPRYYNGLGGGRRYEDELWDAPLLSPNECLAILKRMEMPLLSSLELVYMVDKADTDNELLSYVTTSFPRLSYLEVHRYRADREEAVAHVSPPQFVTFIPLYSLSHRTDAHRRAASRCNIVAHRSPQPRLPRRPWTVLQRALGAQSVVPHISAAWLGGCGCHAALPPPGIRRTALPRHAWHNMGRVPSPALRGTASSVAV